MSLINSTAIPSSGGYELEQSLRFNDNDSPYLSWTPASAGNRKTWTWSAWVKRGNLTSSTQKISGAFNGTNEDSFNFNSDKFTFYVAGANSYGYQTANIYRDLSAWYHFVVAVDTTQGTAANRVKLYVNGVATTFGAKSGLAVVPQNYEFWINGAFVQGIGWDGNNTTYLDGYLAEYNFIDGLAKAPADFGETGDYGEWKPKAYSGSYGTNGFYLPFKQDYTVEGFSTVTWRGTDATQYIGGTGFQPDFTWIKQRDGGANHAVFDSVRGATKLLKANDTNAEATEADTLTAWSSDGFTLGVDSNRYLNMSGNTFVAWNWDMGGSNATLTAGSINSTVRANPTYGQSIVSYTGNATAGATVAHGLSSAPELIIVKGRNRVEDWGVGHTSLGWTKFIRLNTTAAAATATSLWNDTAPSNTLVTLGDSGIANNSSSTTMIMYCFHSVTGYSKFGTYNGTGNASGNSVTLGFEPAFLMIKSSTGAYTWAIFDNVRTKDAKLSADSSGAESILDYTDFTSTGFNLTTTHPNANGSGQSYIYMAFADKREYAYWLDQSGNNNDWTSNNLTESDVMVDSPTNNFCTMNPLYSKSNIVFAEGNLSAQTITTGEATATATINPSTGKWYFECLPVASDNNTQIMIGLSRTINSALDRYPGSSGGNAWGMYSDAGQVYYEGGTGLALGSYTVGDIISVAYDLDASKIWWGKNGTWLGSTAGDPAAGTNSHHITISGSIGPATGTGASGHTVILNAGQDSSFAGAKTAQGNQDGNDIGDFYYAPPTGFLALCTSNLPDVAVIPSEHFGVHTRTGTGSSTSVTGKPLAPDLVWTKVRNVTGTHVISDNVRGVNKQLFSNLTNAEGTATNKLTAFNSDGYTLGADDGSGTGDSNYNGQTYVDWFWKANGSGSSNTNGSITSTVSANADAGFSIVSYTGTGANATVGHGLSSAPEMIIIQNRDAVHSKLVYSVGMGATKGIYFHSTIAALTASTFFQDTTPSSSIFTLGSHASGNSSTKNMIAYCFHSVDGYSKVGSSYTGNGNADGTFIYTGFRPAWVMVKKN